jgi:hypothetical protein
VDALARRAVERLRHPAKRDERGVDGRRPVLPQRRVERLSRDVLLREIRNASLGAGGQRRGNSRVSRLIVDERFERRGQLVGLIAREVEPEQLQRDEPAVARVMRAKYGAKAAGPDLMQDLERATGGRRRVVRGSVGGVQRSSSSA